MKIAIYFSQEFKVFHTKWFPLVMLFKLAPQQMFQTICPLKSTFLYLGSHSVSPGGLPNKGMLNQTMEQHL